MRFLFVIICFPIIMMNVFGSVGKKNLDFNFPQDIITESEKQLKEALKNDDGVSMIDALVKFSLAKSSISEEHFDDVISILDEISVQERSEDIKSLLLYLKYEIYNSHEDIDKANAALRDALEYEDKLKSYDVSKYSKVLKSDELGRRICPTLYDFLQYKKTGISYLLDNIKEGEMQGLIYMNKECSPKDYATLKEYLKAYPKSVWANDIKNLITTLTEQRVSVRFPDQIHSKCQIEMNVESHNAKDVEIILYKFPNDAKEESNKTYFRNDLKKVLSKKVHFEQDSLFFDDKKSVLFEPLSEGIYSVNVAVNGKEEKFGPKVNTYNALKVKNTSYYKIDNPKDSLYKLITVDIKTGEFVKESFEKKRYFSENKDNSEKYLNILTDLGIYRPGDTLHYTIIYQYADVEKKKLIANSKVHIILKDATRKEIAKEERITDNYGQIAGEFTIPTDLTNGRFSLYAYTEKENGIKDAIQTKYFNVSEYKTPSFYIDVEENKHAYEKDSDIRLKGKCISYSGIPLSNREVTVEVEGRVWMWSMPRFDSTPVSVTTKTDEKGEFVATLSAKELQNIARYFNATFKVTDEAGESQECHWNFFVGKIRGISFEGYDDIIIDKPFNLPITFTSSDENETSAMFNYSLALESEPDKILKQGTLNSADTKVDLHDLKSGKYILKASLLEASERNQRQEAGKSRYVGQERDESLEGKEVIHSVILYHETDKMCPVESALWMPHCGQKVDETGMAHITIGTAFKSHIYYVANSRNGIAKEGWVHYEPGIHDFSIKIPDEENQNISVAFKCYYESKLYQGNAYLENPKNRPAVTLSINSFRDNILPNGKEQWIFTFFNQDKKPISGRLALEVISEAVNQLAPNNFLLSNPILSERSVELSSVYHYSKYANAYWIDNLVKGATYQIPELEMYGRWFSWGNKGMYMMAKTRNNAVYALAARPEMEEAAGTVDFADAVTQSSMMISGVNESKKKEEGFNSINVRISETKVALWQPMVNIGENGEARVEFEVPADNTTWRLIAMAFDKSSLHDTQTKTMIASRPIMVKPSLPRFLRDCDNTQLMANVMNRADEEIETEVIIELFDPRSEKVILSETRKEKIAANGMKAVGIDCNLSVLNKSLSGFLGFRVKAETEGVGDGEQVMIPVLNSVMPVVETIPFYLNPEDKDSTIDISHLPNEAEITFEYCNNPVWYCLSALPTIYDSDILTATGLAHNIYAVSLAKGLAETNPIIADALKKMQKDETGGKAEKEISIPFDEETFNKIIEKLCALQNPDGGISWLDWQERESSEYVTYQVLELLGELRQLGFEIIDDKILNLQKNALSYIEKEQCETLKKMKDKSKGWFKKDIDYIVFSPYLYLRTLYPESRFKIQHGCDSILRKTLNVVEKKWRDFSMPTRVYVALSLYRYNKTKTAKLIMESMRQFAVKDSRRGMFWDNLQTFGYRWYSRTALTAAMLEAFNEIDYREEEINQIRKWMLLQKQTTDWGNSSMASEATFALLYTGKQWLNSSEKEYFKRTINRAEDSQDNIFSVKGNTLNILHKAGSPAWGAVYAKFPAEITHAKAFALDEIKLEKDLLKYNGGKIIATDSLKVGDKIQVQLTIKTDRDMSYVTIKDHRAACFEPVDKLSGYHFSDANIKHRESIGYYNDTKDTETRIMVDFLPKGSHVITYDVFVTNSGTFSTGLAEVECELAPQFTAHTEGRVIQVFPLNK